MKVTKLEDGQQMIEMSRKLTLETMELFLQQLNDESNETIKWLISPEVDAGAE